MGAAEVSLWVSRRRDSRVPSSSPLSKDRRRFGREVLFPRHLLEVKKKERKERGERGVAVAPFFYLRGGRKGISLLLFSVGKEGAGIRASGTGQTARTKQQYIPCRQCIN